MAGAATQISSTDFDTSLARLGDQLRERIQARIDELGRRLSSYPHHHMSGTNAYRLRVGDYRIIYRFDLLKNELYLATLGHRREVYR